MEKKLHKPWDVLRKAAQGMIELPVKVKRHRRFKEADIIVVSEFLTPVNINTPYKRRMIALKNEDNRMLQAGWFEDEEWELLLEPKFKVGDLIVIEYKGESWIAKFSGQGQEKVIRVSNVAPMQRKFWDMGDMDVSLEVYNVRRATAEEIAADKKRRWWAELGREVDEYRAGDVVQRDDGRIQTVAEHASNDLRSVYIAEADVPIYTKYLKLVAPVEQRLDK